MKGVKSQAATDFMISYGMAIVVVAVALYVALHLAFFNQRLAPSYCNAAPSFSCIAYTLNKTGAFTLAFSQATGGTLNINAAACSSAVNAIGDAPAFGNVNLIPYSYSSGPQYYPSNSGLTSTLSMYSSSLAVMKVKCYNGGGTNNGVATALVGSTFTGYLWINYTFSNLPGTTNTIERMVSFSTKYS